MEGTLNDLEREFVKNYGKKCLIKGNNIDSNCMLKEYKNVLAGYTRDGEMLKKSIGLIGKRILLHIKIS